MLAPTGPATTAHLPMQFYFHIISISKSLLVALAFGVKKRRVTEEVKKEGRKKGWLKEKSNEGVLCAATGPLTSLKGLLGVYICAVDTIL